MSFSSQKAYETWMRIIADESLAELVIDRDHDAIDRRFDLDLEQRAIAKTFAGERGTRWNIENLRFRAAGGVGAVLESYLPRTVKMLTLGNADWLQDITFEYLAFYRWQEFGQLRFAECERFADYVRKRIVKRRVVPPHFETMLAFEMRLVRLLKRTADVPAEAWKKPVFQPSLRPRPGPVVELIELPVDLSEWIASGQPQPVIEEPITMLAVVPSLTETHRLHRLSFGSRVVFEACDGSATASEIAEQLEAEHGVAAAQVTGLIERWIEERALTA